MKMICKKICFILEIDFSKLRKKTVLCLGLDPHLDLIPEVFQYKHKVNKIIYNKDNIKIVDKFCNSILDNCIDLVPIIKIQIAFFEQLGPEGMKLLSKLCNSTNKTLCLIDAKRKYRFYKPTTLIVFEPNSPYPCDAITINPWLGNDS